MTSHKSPARFEKVVEVKWDYFFYAMMMIIGSLMGSWAVFLNENVSIVRMLVLTIVLALSLIFFYWICRDRPYWRRIQ